MFLRGELKRLVTCGLEKVARKSSRRTMPSEFSSMLYKLSSSCSKMRVSSTLQRANKRTHRSRPFRRNRVKAKETRRETRDSARTRASMASVSSENETYPPHDKHAICVFRSCRDFVSTGRFQYNPIWKDLEFTNVLVAVYVGFFHKHSPSSARLDTRLRHALKSHQRAILHRSPKS